MLSLFVSNLSEENEVFRFANSYPQPAFILCVAPFIAFIFDKFTFFPLSPFPMIGADAAALVELLPHLCSHRESTFPSERFFEVILSIIWKGGKPVQDQFWTCSHRLKSTKNPAFWRGEVYVWGLCREMDSDNIIAPCFSPKGLVLLSAALLWHQRIGVREKINHKHNIKMGKSITIQLATLVCSYVLQKGILILQPPALSIQ